MHLPQTLPLLALTATAVAVALPASATQRSSPQPLNQPQPQAKGTAPGNNEPVNGQSLLETARRNLDPETARNLALISSMGIAGPLGIAWLAEQKGDDGWTEEDVKLCNDLLKSHLESEDWGISYGAFHTKDCKTASGAAALEKTLGVPLTTTARAGSRLRPTRLARPVKMRQRTTGSRQTANNKPPVKQAQGVGRNDFAGQAAQRGSGTGVGAGMAAFGDGGSPSKEQMGVGALAGLTAAAAAAATVPWWARVVEGVGGALRVSGAVGQ